MNYTQNYEYACSLVRLMIDREENVDSDQNKHIYDSHGLMCSLFTIDYSTITNNNVRSTISARLKNTDNENNVSLISRIKGTYIDLYAALGSDFVASLRANVCASITDLTPSPSERKNAQKTITDFFNEFPYVLVCVIGEKYYQEKFINHANKLALVNKLNQEPKNQPISFH